MNADLIISGDLFFLLFSSMFVLLKGVTKVEAFRIGQEIVDTVTSLNPKPVNLKFEKVNCKKL